MSALIVLTLIFGVAFIYYVVLGAAKEARLCSNRKKNELDESKDRVSDLLSESERLDSFLKK